MTGLLNTDFGQRSFHGCICMCRHWFYSFNLFEHDCLCLNLWTILVCFTLINISLIFNFYWFSRHVNVSLHSEFHTLSSPYQFKSKSFVELHHLTEEEKLSHRSCLFTSCRWNKLAFSLPTTKCGFSWIVFHFLFWPIFSRSCRWLLIWFHVSLVFIGVKTR